MLRPGDVLVVCHFVTGDGYDIKPVVRLQVVFSYVGWSDSLHGLQFFVINCGGWWAVAASLSVFNLHKDQFVELSVECNEVNLITEPGNIFILN